MGNSFSYRRRSRRKGNPSFCRLQIKPVCYETGLFPWFFCHELMPVSGGLAAAASFVFSLLSYLGYFYSTAFFASTVSASLHPES